MILKAQERYKKAFDKILRNTTEEVTPGDDVYLRIKRKDDRETRHELAPISEGPFPVKKVYKENKTVLLERPDKTVENLSRSRVILAPKRASTKELLESRRPIIIKEVFADFHAPEQVNLRHIRTDAPDDERNEAVTQNDEVE